MKRVLLNIFLAGLVVLFAILSSNAQGTLASVQDNALKSGIDLDVRELGPDESFALYTKGSLLFQTIPDKKTLVADETWVMASGKNSFRIICSNDELQSKLFNKWKKNMNRYSAVKKNDRGGEYWELSYYFDNDQYTAMMTFIKGGFK